jgi:hypothetical protein
MTLKLILVQLILCLTSLACCYGQTNQPISIPIVKENVSIDAVLDKFIAQRPATLKQLARLGGDYEDDVKLLLKDSCLLIPVSQEDSVKEASIYVESKSKTSINQEINIDVHLKFKYACFNYKGYRVFIWTRNTFGQLFSETDRTQTYGFIYYANKNQTYPREWVGDGMDYQIKNGAIAKRVPTIITTKQNK